MSAVSDETIVSTHSMLSRAKPKPPSDVPDQEPLVRERGAHVGEKAQASYRDETIDIGGQDEKVVLNTLGEGPSAPGAADEVAEDVQAGIEDVPPGMKGWINLFGVIGINAICYGMTNSFGTFQEYYVSHFHLNPTAASWIGSIQLCLMPLLGCFAGPLFDSGYLRYLTVSGGFLYTFSLLMTSISKQYYQFLLAHGIGAGLGMGIIFSPSVSTLAHHFGKSKYRSLAYGLQASGSSLGGILFPILARSLLPKIGFGWTLRVFAFIVLAIIVQSFFTLSTTVPPRRKVAILSPTVFRTTGYALHVLGCCMCSLCVYCPLTFAVTYGVSHGISPSLGNIALTVINACAIIGRVLPLILAQRVGAINVVCASGLVAAIMLFSWTKATTVPGIIIYDAMYGIGSGGYAAGVNPAAASFAPHTNQTGLYLGMFFFTTSFFWLSGTPATAALINARGYLAASMFCGSTLLLGICFILLGRKQRVKALGTPWV
ncbi:major facilitator superfamily domain-containing protein [Kockovaella imperatae]|uniref:Major facilitator superfamily domain-containing protein n=1 Tax=Kockovaella imperatae TaxID=4999 RepID=A0A1Y1UTN4_9TREE|nr:major facilitator superfamily domain-containing protein [Kockovaella imperatae]ORX40884.1 major facilitator superfamily domain-containing protein [Kockovaella imperatae]